jgi:hypothetical protein
VNHPKAYDAKGRVLEEGSPVGWPTEDGREGFIQEITVQSEPALFEIVIDFPQHHGRLTTRAASGRFSHLFLITDEEKEDANG